MGKGAWEMYKFHSPFYLWLKIATMFSSKIPWNTFFKPIPWLKKKKWFVSGTLLLVILTEVGVGGVLELNERKTHKTKIAFMIYNYIFCVFMPEIRFKKF